MKVLLIYPQFGSIDGITRDIPLSLIYAASHTIKRGHSVKILDLRGLRGDWREHIKQVIYTDEYGLVGLSVMTGLLITKGIEISKFIKSLSNIPIVWGGPHPTILPEQTLVEPYIDYVIRDWGSVALCDLVDHLEHGIPAKNTILGLGYKENGHCVLAPPQTCFEMLDWRDLPYDLVDFSRDKYSRFKGDSTVFPMFSAMGCPYKCSFCMSPTVYKKIIGKKWVAYDSKYVLEHIEYVAAKYHFDAIQILDDDSFVDLERMRDLLSEFIRRGHNKKFRLEFRGGRINELDRMDDAFLHLLCEAGTEMIFIGIESGSSRSLEKMNKGISVEQIIRVNRKLVRFPQLKPNYNLMFGIPGETMSDVLETKELILQLIKDNPSCYIGLPGIWKPMPGSVLTDVAVRDYGLTLPDSLEAWSQVDSFDAEPLVYSWFTPDMVRMINLITLASVTLDGKMDSFSGSLGPILGRFAKMLRFLYKPILELRLKHNCTIALIEYRLWSFILKRMGTLIKIGKKLTFKRG